MAKIKKLLKETILSLGLLGTMQTTTQAVGLENKLAPPSPEYKDVMHTKPEWKEINKGIEFTTVDVYRGKDLVDRLAVLKVDPKYNGLKVYSAFDPKTQTLDPKRYYNIEGWEMFSKALAMFNSAQYEAQPWGKPCGPVLERGVELGHKNNNASGVLVSEPKDDKLLFIDLIDLRYDQFDMNKTPYTEAVTHWPILLDRKGNIRVKNTDWQADRTVVAMDYDNNFLVFNTSNGFFTLYNFGRFLKDSDQRIDKGFNIKTAMNMDGGYEADLIVNTSNFKYLHYGQYETYGPSRNATVLNGKIGLPTAVGIFPR